MMGCEIKFLDGETLNEDKADCYEESDSFLDINDSNEETIVSVNSSQVKYIKWQ